MNLEILLPHIPIWLMVMFRITGIFILAPVLGTVTLPMRIKVFWALTMSLCVYPVILSRPSSASIIGPMLGSDLSLWRIPAAVALELMVGALIGLGAGLPIAGMQVAGHIADQQIGLGIAGVFNPELNEQAGILGEFYFILATWIFVILGGHRVMVGTLLSSFDHVPLCGFNPDGQVLDLLVGLLSSMFEFALHVSAPLLCLVFLETVAMGFIARTIPQLNILSVGFAMRILMGISLLMSALAMHTTLFSEYVGKVLGLLARFTGID